MEQEKEKKPINIESILNQFKIVEDAIKRAKLPFEIEFTPKTSIDVSLYELIKSYHQIENLVREIDPERFGVKRITQPSLYTPPLSVNKLNLCPYCGDPECQSDHK